MPAKHAAPTQSAPSPAHRFAPLAAPLRLTRTHATRLDFASDSGLALVIEPHAPGVWRLRAGPAAPLAEDASVCARAQARAALLLARSDATGEATLASLPVVNTGWRVSQGEMALEIAQTTTQTTAQTTAPTTAQARTRAASKTPPTPHIALWHHDICLFTATLAHDTQAHPAWQMAWPLRQDEALYGLGQTTGSLNRRGATIVSDAPAARALPLLWSPRGWGVYANTLARVIHELDVDGSAACTLTLEDALLDVFLFVGEPAEILNQYTQLTGRAGQPPLWAMGLSLQQAPGQSLTQTAELIQACRAHQVPVDTVQLAAPATWAVHDAKLNVEWDAQRYPEPRQNLAALDALAVHTVAPSFPGVRADTAAFAELEDRGWLLADEDGNAHVFEAGHGATGGAPYALLDLTHREVYRLWVERHRQLHEDGVTAFACDAQLAIPDSISARGGETGAVLRTLYPMLARQALFDAVAAHKTPPEGVVFTTDLGPGAQRLPWQSAPSQHDAAITHTWSGMAAQLRAALTLGASGLPVQCHKMGRASAAEVPDAPGALHEALTPELYLRWLTANVFSANFAWQGEDALMPWAFGPETLAHARTWLHWRYRLIPYLLGAIEDAARTGLPVQRAMALAFPADPAAHAWETQYLLGPALLVAPPTASGEASTVYLPAGEAWWDLNTGWRYEGGTTWTVRCGPEQFPVFGREGHMLCLGPAADHTREINTARLLDEVWMFGMPLHNPVVMRNKIRVMQMQGSSYIKGLEGLRILPSDGLEIKRRGAEVRISRAR